MEFLSAKLNIPFMRFRFVALVGSLILIGVSVFMWFATGPEKYSVDFLGGTEVVVQFEKQIGIGVIRGALNTGGLDGAVVQSFEEGTNDFSIRLKADQSEDNPKKVREALSSIKDNPFTLLKEDFVGPVIGGQIRQDGVTALVLAIIGILIYISVRFELRFAVGAIVALVHDVIITTGVFIISGKEISAGVLAALLTIIGYSLNDTIIVYDRIRENFNTELKKGGSSQKARDKIDLVELINQSINQTLSRTLLTSATTLFVVTTLWLMGGGAVQDLAFALVIGIVVGTYSSIFIACTVILLWIRKK